MATPKLSRREREIMDIVLATGEATVGDVRGAMADPPSYSAVRSTMNILEEKGHLKHRTEGTRFVYLPTTDPSTARVTALQHVIRTFFGGSTADAVSALLGDQEEGLSDEELSRISNMVRDARREGR